MTPHERSPYSAIIDHPPLNSQTGAKSSSGRSSTWKFRTSPARCRGPQCQRRPARQCCRMSPTGPGTNTALVGVWRYFKLFEKLDIRPTLSCNARVCEDYARVAAQARDAGWELMAHGYDQNSHAQARGPAWHDPQGDRYNREVHGQALGRLASSGPDPDARSADLLTEAGSDTLAIRSATTNPPRSAPSTGRFDPALQLETHDIATMALQHHESPYWVTKCRDTLDRYLDEGPGASRSWRSPSTPISWASRTGSAISNKPTPTSTAAKASCI